MNEFKKIIENEKPSTRGGTREKFLARNPPRYENTSFTKGIIRKRIQKVTRKSDTQLKARVESGENDFILFI